jgi:aldehyde:ferredoxin oxidoreductase
MPGLGIPEPLDRFADKGKGRAAALMQNFADLYNSLKLCQFAMTTFDVPIVVKWLNYVTGWKMDAQELLRVGERSLNIKRLLNISCGLTKADDTLPYRITHEPFSDGASAGHLPNLSLMLDEYYEFRGWDKEGVPTVSKLRELELA